MDLARGSKETSTSKWAIDSNLAGGIFQIGFVILSIEKNFLGCSLGREHSDSEIYSSVG